MVSPGNDPPRLAAPSETLVVGRDGTVLLAVDGVLVVPPGTRVRYDAGGAEATVVGVRLDRIDAATLQLILDVDSSGDPALDALEEADAEAQVVEAAEEIAGAATGEVGQVADRGTSSMRRSPPASTGSSPTPRSMSVPRR